MFAPGAARSAAAAARSRHPHREPAAAAALPGSSSPRGFSASGGIELF